MKYIGQQSDLANSNDKTGVILLNLGTPDRAICPSLRRYLGEFLMDPRVIELPKLLSWILVKGIIINVRSHKSAANYRKIWTEQGSPLLVNSLALARATQQVLGDSFMVETAMRYGQPDVQSVLLEMHNAGIRKLIVIPLYPQYSGSTNGSAFDAVASALKKFRRVPDLQFVSNYFHQPLYINAIADSIQQHWQKNGKAQKLLMSFHGVPQKYITQGDPYQDQCAASARAIADKLNLKKDEWMLVYQSRFGAQQWLEPYCDKTLMSLPAEGIKSVDIICPGFSVDCLETLEEIDDENRAYFLNAGGEQYSYIPCLNAQPAHAELMAEIVRSSAG